MINNKSNSCMMLLIRLNGSKYNPVMQINVRYLSTQDERSQKNHPFIHSFIHMWCICSFHYIYIYTIFTKKSQNVNTFYEQTAAGRRKTCSIWSFLTNNISYCRYRWPSLTCLPLFIQNSEPESSRHVSVHMSGWLSNIEQHLKSENCAVSLHTLKLTSALM